VRLVISVLNHLFFLLASQLSYAHHLRPFKNPNFMKNVNRRAKNLKTVWVKREKGKELRESRRLAREELMKTDPEAARRIPDEAPNYCSFRCWTGGGF